MGNSNPDSGGGVDFELVSGTNTLQTAQLMYEYVTGGVSKTVSPVLSRSDIVSIRGATGTPSAFDAAMAASGAATWYSTLRTDATNAGITGSARPEERLRLYVAAKWADY